jgi:hypothetical protein
MSTKISVATAPSSREEIKKITEALQIFREKKALSHYKTGHNPFLHPTQKDL